MRFVLVEVIPPHYSSETVANRLTEAISLIETYGGQVVKQITQHRPHPHPSTYLGSGKIQELIDCLETELVDVVVLNQILSPSLLFRLEKMFWPINPRIQVWDRVDLILAIFSRHAHTREAQLQIEIARLSHLGPRIYGLGGSVLSKQGGGIGQRGGGGETNIEIERRRIKDKLRLLKKQLQHLVDQKQSRIKYRLDKGFGPVALVGYTSAGKTTLFNALVNKSKTTSPTLFTTLDTVVGRLHYSSSKPPILLSDTIGFIQDLPPSLVQSFRSTLMESLAAKLILHVINLADPDYRHKAEVVDQILSDLNISVPIVRVYNQIDRLSSPQLSTLKTFDSSPNSLYLSAATGVGLNSLIKLLFKRLKVPNLV